MEIKIKLMKKLLVLSSLCVLVGCRSDNITEDATGTFQATETIISSETAGKILELNVEQGQELKAGQAVGCIDSTQVYLASKQLEQNIKALLRGRPNIQIQVEALKNELAVAESDRKRIQNLVKAEAASQKMLDDASARVTVIQSKIEALESNLGTNTGTINEQAEALTIQLLQLKDQLKKCRIINPINGMVLESYARVFEMSAPGKPLYKIADLHQMDLKAYITQQQFSAVKLGQEVQVRVDSSANTYKIYKGKVTWINNKAEFTPKTIQTKDERANLVYGIKIQVQNDGFLKIGMYGEVLFN